MKKFLFTLLAVSSCLVYKAQLSLTKAANEPAPADVNSAKFYDSVGVVPKSIGLGQNWNFGSFVQTTVNTISNYANAIAVPSASNFPGCTLVEVQSNGDKLYWKSVSSPSVQFELLGMEQVSGLSLTYTNTAIAAMWPINMSYVLVDPFSGTLAAMTQTGTLSGSITTTGSGTGSLNLPGNFPVYNILQVKTDQQIFIGVPALAYNATITATEYSYYSGTQKFPLVTVKYEREVEQIGTPTITVTNKIKVNNAVLTGLNEKNFDASFQIFPNPAKDAFQLELENPNGAAAMIEIISGTGSVVRTISLQNNSIIRTDVQIRDLDKGMYMVRTRIGERVSGRKLIIE